MNTDIEFLLMVWIACRGNEKGLFNIGAVSLVYCNNIKR